MPMDNLVTAVREWVTADHLATAARVASTVFVAFLALRLLRRLKLARLDAQRAMLLRRAISFAIIAGAGVAILHLLGLGLTPLLGAAGVLTIALGFASQTSVSNVISGFFLIGERPFVVGDFVEVEGTRGTVISIDMMSVQLRTIDNLMVRIPNETMLKTKVVNYTRFPVRRIDLKIGLAFEQPIEPVRLLLEDAVGRPTYSLVEPSSQFRVMGFSSSGVDVEMSVWVRTIDVVEARTALYSAVHEALLGEDIRFALPALRVSGGPVSEPVPLELAAQSVLPP